MITCVFCYILQYRFVCILYFVLTVILIEIIKLLIYLITMKYNLVSVCNQEYNYFII